MELLFDKIAGGEFVGLCDARLGDQGLKPLQFLYAEYWRGADGRIDFDLARRKIPELADLLQNDLLCIDVEGPSWMGLYSACTDQEQWRRDNDEVARLVDLCHELLPGVKLSLFASCPSLDSWHWNGWHAGQREGRDEVWQRYLNALRHLRYQRSILARRLDWYAPCLYFEGPDWKLAHDRSWYMRDRHTDEHSVVSPLFERQNTALRVWINTYRHALQQSADMLPAKPMIPVCSVQCWNSGPDYYDAPVDGELVTPSWVLKSLEAIRPHCDSIAMWLSYPRNIGGFAPEHYFASDGWQSIVEEWAEKQKGE